MDTVISTSYLANSTNFRTIKMDDKASVRVLVVGLTYNKEEFCRVYNKITDEDNRMINYHRRVNIDIRNNKISEVQLENARNSNDVLHENLVDILIRMYNIKETKKHQELFTRISDEIETQIIIYDCEKNIIFKTEKNYEFKIHTIYKDEAFKVIYNIYKFKPKSSLDISAGKKKINFPDIKYDEKEQEENRNRFLEREFTIESISDFITNIVPPPPEYIKSPITSNKIAEWNFILKCVSCNIYYPIYVDNKKEFINKLYYYFKYHKCTTGKPYNPTSICKECKNYIFKGLVHVCNNSQIACKMYTKNKKFIIRFNKLLAIK